MIKRSNILARTLHKWIGLFVGIQILIWLITGLYMVIVDLDFIHGDPLVRNMQQTIVVPDSSPLSIAALRAKYPDASRIDLRPVMEKTFFSITTAEKRYLLDPESGEIVSPLNEDSAREIARFHFNGDANITSATLITAYAPMEIQTRRLPLWRLDFDDRFSTSFYIDPYSGRLATRRHQYWRIFDFLWMLHIMDYDQRTDAHNLLLKTAEVTGLAFAITGLWLLFYSFSGRRKKKSAVK
ncbi:MAG: hypothetical protein GQ538_11905 [Xanthomonadales bacterium]|nr:hypothetical protein [Xanthomonadales bacterium]